MSIYLCKKNSLWAVLLSLPFITPPTLPQKNIHRASSSHSCAIVILFVVPVCEVLLFEYIGWGKASTHCTDGLNYSLFSPYFISFLFQEKKKFDKGGPFFSPPLPLFIFSPSTLCETVKVAHNRKYEGFFLFRFRFVFHVFPKLFLLYRSYV